MSERKEDARRQRLTGNRKWGLFASLRAKLVVLLALAMLPAAVLACLQALSNYRQLSALSEESALQAAILSMQEEENVIIRARRVLKTLAVLPEITGRTPGRCDKTLAAVRSTSDFYGSLAVTDERGEVVCSAPPTIGQLNVSDRPWFRSAVGRGTFTVTADEQGVASDARVMVAALPLFDGGEAITGLLSLAIRPQWLRELLVKTGAPDVARVALVDRAGMLIANGSEQSAKPTWLPDPGLLRANLTGEPRSIQVVDGSAGNGIIAVAPLLRDDVYVVVGNGPSSSTVASVWRLWGAVGYPVIMWLIALAVAWFGLDRLVVRPILRLERTAAAFATGQESIRTSGLADMPAEISLLGRTMNAMADTLAIREADFNLAVDEQKILLKELHHRVKNNLQVITSLLNLQIQRATGKTERWALRATQDRIYALAKVHDSLYQVSRDRLIRLDDTLTQIADHLVRTHDPPGKPIQVHYDMDPVETSSKNAVPIALLLTEAISSVLGLADPESSPFDLRISLKRRDGETVVLAVETDRPPANAHATGDDDLRAKLIAGFVKQLGGLATLEMESGYRLRVTIPYEG